MKKKVVRASFWSVLFVLSILVTTTSIQASAATANNVKDYLPSLGYQYEIYNGSPDMYSGGTDMSTTCEEVKFNKADAINYNDRSCTIKEGVGGITYYYDQSKWRISLYGTGSYFTQNYYFPMTAGKTYTKKTNGSSYTYTVESVNSTVKVGNKTYTDVIRIKNEKGGYTYIAKNHGAIFVSAKRDGKVVPTYKVVDYKKLTTTTAAKTKKYTTTAAVNVRKTANTKYKALGTLKKGTVVTVKGTSGGWYKIAYKGSTAYVSKSYVKVTTVAKQPTSTTNTTTSTTKKYTTTAAVNVRKTANTKYKALGTLKKGTVVTVKGTSGAWYKIAYKGSTAYVSKSYVKVTTVKKTAEQPKQPTEQAKFTNYETTEELNIRAGAGTNYKIQDILVETAIVKVIGTSGSWSKISYNGKTGYVATKYLIISDEKVDFSDTTEVKKGYKSGEYIAGETIPEGEFKIRATFEGMGTMTIRKATGEFISSDMFSYINYVTLEKGQKIELENAYAIPLEYATPTEAYDGSILYSPDTYKVGYDLPAGYYKVYSDESRNTFLMKSKKANGFLSSDTVITRFQRDDFVELEKDMYIRIENGFLQYTGVD